MRWLSDNALERLRDAAEEPDLGATSYRLVRKIGSGGMSVVYLADDAKLGRKVAVKVMSLSDDTGEMQQRMLREAHIVAQLEHPGIVPIHDVGTLPDGRIYYAMKYVQGRRLDQYAKSERTIADLLRVFQRVCEAVAFAHSFNVIHRDLKPENVMVGSFGEVLVMDWGIAKVLGADAGDVGPDGASQSQPSGTAQLTTVTEVRTIAASGDAFGDASPTLIQRIAMPGEGATAHGVVVGTPAYMAPEQARGDNASVDARTDVYALGAILYFICTGKPPSESGGRIDPLTDASDAGVVPPRRLNRTIGRALEAVCLKALSRDPSSRYTSARELEGDVAAYLDGLPVAAYRESIFERGARIVVKNRFLVLLIVAYLVMRLLVMIFLGR